MDFSCLHNTWSNGILMRLFSGTKVYAPQSVMRHPVAELVNLLKIIPKPSEIQSCRRQRRPLPCPGPLPPFEDVSSGTSTKGSLLESADNKIRRSTRVSDLPFYPHLLRLEDHRGTSISIAAISEAVSALSSLDDCSTVTLFSEILLPTLAYLTVNTAGEQCCGAMEGSLSSVPDSLTHYPCLCICELFAALSFNACNRQKLLCVATGFITTSVSHELLMLECEFPVFSEAPLRWQNIKEP
ncbi:hypothetical protein T03_13560 [Trichinella britovi]|uniref:Uncharacterized protein n=1 Tax=Trichinella britovi TaxID=45882 RepID=A0A0V1CEA1_TRIBR|nr:hypothetical protein T03_13560 [Trichinella britovi]